MGAQMATVNISPNTRLVAVQCRNTGGPYGLMAEIKAGAKVLSVSDSSWKCSNKAHGGWEKPGFKGKFPAAVYTRQQGSFNKQAGEWRTMSPRRKVLWTRGGGRDKSIFCRKELRGRGRRVVVRRRVVRRRVVRRVARRVTVRWGVTHNTYLSGYSKGPHKYSALRRALMACYKRGKGCAGVTYEPYSKKYTLRRGRKLKRSPTKEKTWVKKFVTVTSRSTGGRYRTINGKRYFFKGGKRYRIVKGRRYLVRGGKYRRRYRRKGRKGRKRRRLRGKKFRVRRRKGGRWRTINGKRYFIKGRKYRRRYRRKGRKGRKRRRNKRRGRKRNRRRKHRGKRRRRRSKRSRRRRGHKRRHGKGRKHRRRRGHKRRHVKGRKHRRRRHRRRKHRRRKHRGRKHR